MNKELLMLLVAITATVCLSSCSDDDHDHECQECHIAYMMDGAEIEVPITNAAGGEEFCEDELEDAESADFSYELTEDYVTASNDTVPAGTYSDIHCEDHAHEGEE